MSLPARPLSRAWIAAPLCALAFLLWGDHVRLQRVKLVSRVPAAQAPVDPDSPTGYAGGKRWLIVPEHDNPTYQWIEETQLMLARGDGRVRSVSYENAPLGRDVHAASPYRWWLVALAWLDHAGSGRPMGLCVERAALFADPLLQVLLLLACALFVARHFGRFCAALFSLGLAGMFPLASAFLPGIANDFGLSQACVLWSVLPLVAGTLAARHAPRWFFAAGAAGGCGLWIGAAGQTPLLAGIAAGGILAALLSRPGPAAAPGVAAAAPPWRAWAAGGAIASLLAYLVEYFPGHLGMELRVNHPLYGLAWLGLGELLARLDAWIRGRGALGGLRGAAACVLAAAAVAALPVAAARTGERIFLPEDLLSTRLTNLPGGAVAEDMGSWLIRDGPWGAPAAACLPLLLLLPAAWLLLSRRTAARRRAAIAIALGPALAALGLAAVRLRWWNTLDAALLALLAAAAAALPGEAPSRALRGAWAALMAAIVACGVLQLLPAPASAGSGVLRLTRAEVEGLYERSLSHWIADHAGPAGATVLAPPFRTSSLCFYGGLRGLGTQNWENADGLSATFRIATAMRPDEALSLIDARGVTRIVLPSWDTDLDDFARLRLKDPSLSFVHALEATSGGAFRWLRPVPYALPPVAGFPDASALVLEVTAGASLPAQQGRFVEYLVEMHQLEQAQAAGRALLLYPADLGARTALAQLAKASGDEPAFARELKSIVSGLSSGADRALPWDRRVSLAVALAIGGRADLSQAQVRRCLAEADAERLRFLTTESLYHLLLLARRSDGDFPDPDLRALSLQLLPESLRASL